MSVKLRPYSEYRDSGIAWLGQIPAHWTAQRAKYFFREVDERSTTGAEELLSVSHLTGVTPRSQKNVTMFMAESNVGHKVCRQSDLVINTMWAWMGALGVARQTGLVSPAYAVYRPHPSSPLVPKYMDYLLRMPAYIGEYICSSTGVTSSRLRLYPEQFFRIPVLSPPVSEQQVMARFLAAAEQQIARLIRAKRRLIELLTEQKQAIIHRAVTRGLDPNVRLKQSGIEWLGNVPQHWSVRQIGHFAKVGNGSTPSRSSAGYWHTSGYPWLNSASVNQGRITKANQFVTDLALRECHLPRVKPASILVAITGQGKTRGTPALLDFEATINQHIAFITIKDPLILPEYIYMFLIGAYRELRAISDDAGSTKGALTCEDIKGFKVALPPYEEQQHVTLLIRRQLDKVDFAAAHVQREIDLLREYRTRLISDVVTGKLDVRSVELPAIEEADAVPDLDEDPDADADQIDTEEAAGTDD